MRSSMLDDWSLRKGEKNEILESKSDWRGRLLRKEMHTAFDASEHIAHPPSISKRSS